MLIAYWLLPIIALILILMLLPIKIRVRIPPYKIFVFYSGINVIKLYSALKGFKKKIHRKFSSKKAKTRSKAKSGKKKDHEADASNLSESSAGKKAESLQESKKMAESLQESKTKSKSAKKMKESVSAESLSASKKKSKRSGITFKVGDAFFILTQTLVELLSNPLLAEILKKEYKMISKTFGAVKLGKIDWKIGLSDFYLQGVLQVFLSSLPSNDNIKIKGNFLGENRFRGELKITPLFLLLAGLSFVIFQPWPSLLKIRNEFKKVLKTKKSFSGLGSSESKD